MEKKNSKVVTLRSYSSTAQADIVATLLQGMGIPVQVVNGISSNIIPYVSDNMVKILVLEKDLQKAEEMLAAQVEK